MHQFHEPPAAQPSDTQFTLRGLAIVVIVAAGLSAMLMPWMRSPDVIERQGTTASLAGSALGIGVHVLISCYRRVRAERKAGFRYLSLASPLSSRRRWLGSIAAILGIMAAVMAPIWMVSIGPSTADTTYLFLRAWGGMFLGLLAGPAVIHIWWNRISESVELCEHGVIVKAIRFDPWEQFRAYCWEASGKRVELHRKVWVTSARVPNELRHEADAILAEHLPTLGKALEHDRATGLR